VGAGTHAYRKVAGLAGILAAPGGRSRRGQVWAETGLDLASQDSLQETHADELLETASEAYLAGMMKGLQHWGDADNRGLFNWYLPLPQDRLTPPR